MSLASDARPAPAGGVAAPRHGEKVVVIGGGAAGALTAFSLARAGLYPVVISDGGTPGHGVAYATSDPLHRLNVPAGRMSICPDDPESFLRWIRHNVDSAAGNGDFVPRAWYGDYLTSVLGDLVSSGRAEVWRARAHRLNSVSGWRPDESGPGVEISLSDGRRLRAHSAVLAVGCPPPQADWAPPMLAADPRLVVDPWPTGVLTEVAGTPSRPREVLLVGTGLTMVDVALSVAARNPQARITAVSRNGLLSTAHLPVPSSPIPIPELPVGSMTLDAVREFVAASVDRAIRLTGDWRPGTDGLRPVTQALWQALSRDDRARFLREDRRRWDVLRHRMAPQVAEALNALQACGRLRIEALGERTMDDYPWRRFDSVVACTGQGVRLAASPLLQALLADGSVRADALGLGLECDLLGRPMSRDGRIWREVSVIGALRRGQLWESTAIPELRAQAAEIAKRLSAGSRVRPLRA